MLLQISFFIAVYKLEHWSANPRLLAIDWNVVVAIDWHVVVYVAGKVLHSLPAEPLNSDGSEQAGALKLMNTECYDN